MPELSFSKILSVSSEEKNFPADNLLKKGEFKKWKCVPGEPKAVVMLQLSEASEIEKIDIGNEGSAFVEVFVGKSCIKEDDYQVILVASSFMTPIDSRNSQNLNKVRFFNKDQLSKSVSNQKWDVVKVVSSQPFNKNVSYGLSFITLYSPPATDAGKVQSVFDLGSFMLKSDDKKDPKFRPGSLFERSKQKPINDPPMSVAAAIRDASAIILETKSQEDKKLPSTCKEMSSEVDIPLVREPRSVTKSRSQERSNENSSSSVKNIKSIQLQSKVDPVKEFKEQKGVKNAEVEFNSVMKGVVLVLSGFQNPLRGQLRDRAVAMGAKYKADWEKGCTHLISAYDNTPKFSQVKGLGKIVRKEWILDSFEKKEIISWRKYRLGGAPSPVKEKGVRDSDKKQEKSADDGTSKRITSTDSKKDVIKGISVTKRSSRDVFDVSTDSECDTDEEVARFERQKMEKLETSKEQSTNDNSDSTEGDLFDQLPKLPHFLRGFKFLLHGEFSPEDMRCLKRYITAYDGCLADYMNNDVTAVIAYGKWDNNFDEALEDNPKLVFLQPDWLVTCIKQQKAVPFNTFLITP